MTLLTETLPGAPGGMNLALPAQELDDTEARYIQDGLVDKPGILRSRGPVTPIAGFPTTTYRGTGLAVTVNPQGTPQYAALCGDATHGLFQMLNSTQTAFSDYTWPFVLPSDPYSSAAGAYSLMDCKPSIAGGAWVGTSDGYDASSTKQASAFWFGGTKPDYSTGTIKYSGGSFTVQGSGTAFTANVVPGMFVFSGPQSTATAPSPNYFGAGVKTLIGVVRSVDSDTQLTLQNPSPYDSSGTAWGAAIGTLTGQTYNITSLRGFQPRIVKGLITTSTTSTTVTGGNTKWISQGLPTVAEGSRSSNYWNLYRQSDGTWIGRISQAVSETSLTLIANAAIAVVDTPYVAIRGDGDWGLNIQSSTSKVGWLNAVFAERQWYANVGTSVEKTSRVWFSDPNDMEGVDLSTYDGDFVDIPSTVSASEPIRAIQPTYNSLLLFKETETYALSGTGPTSFSVRKLEDDGVLNTAGVVPYGGGAIWPGRNGVYFYDGVNTQNITQQKLGDVYKNTIRQITHSRYRCWGMVARNHYMLFLENVAPPLVPRKGTTAQSVSQWTIVINMVTGAVTLFTNVGIRGAIIVPKTTSRQAWFLVNDATKGNICDAETLFDVEGLDTLTSQNSPTTGPDIFFESKKFDIGDGLRLKRFKRFSVWYLSQSAGIKMDTVLGLNNVGTTLSSTFPASVYTWDQLAVLFPNWDTLAAQFATWDDVVAANFQPRQARFSKKSQYFSVRLYRENSTGTRVQFGPFQLAFKTQRPGRIS